MVSIKRKSMFLLYSPLNQGLKLAADKESVATITVFTLQSIKSRIETRDLGLGTFNQMRFYSTVH